MRGPVIFPARRQQSKRSKMGRSKKDAPCVGIDTARHAVSSTGSLHLPREFFCPGSLLPGSCTHFPRRDTRIPSGVTDQMQPPAAVAILQQRHKDRKSVVEGKRVSVRVDIGGRRSIKKKK